MFKAVTKRDLSPRNSFSRTTTVQEQEGEQREKEEDTSEAENNLGSGTHEHPTPHYTLLSIPVETANVCVFIAPNINFSYPCEDGEVESTHTSGEGMRAFDNKVTELFCRVTGDIQSPHHHTICTPLSHAHLNPG